MAQAIRRVSFLILVLTCLGAQPQRPAENVSAQLLRQYEEAPETAIRRVVEERLDVRAAVFALRKDTTAPVRLRAALALELAFAGLRDDMAPRPLRNPAADMGSSRQKPIIFADVFNAAFDLATSVKDGEPFVTAWHEAALAMLEGGAEVPPTAVTGSGASAHLLETFLDRTVGTFDKGRWHLARASVHERVIAEILDYEWPTYRGSHPASGNTVGALIEGNLARARTAALLELQKAREDEPYRALADIHIAQILLERNKRDDLTEALARVKDAPGLSLAPSTLYLARLIEGRIEEALGRGSEATAAFRAATQTIPGADAAAFSLASRLYLEGDRIQADALVRQVFAARDVTDPWSFFLMPEYETWETKLQAVRVQRR